MKEDKFCLSKSVAFIAVVAFILVGVVVFTNYMNSQKVGGTPKASTACTAPSFCTTRACGDIKGAQGGILDYTDAGGDCGSVGGVALNCCVAKPQNTPVPPAPGATTCEGNGGKWYATASYADCTKVSGSYELVAGATDEQYWGGHICCKAKDLPWPTDIPVGSNTCRGFGGDWYNVACNAVGTADSYEAVSPTSPAIITDLASQPASANNCCKPKTQDQTLNCGYYKGEECFKDSVYSTCAKVKEALGGGWRDTIKARTSCGANKICCWNPQ